MQVATRITRFITKPLVLLHLILLIQMGLFIGLIMHPQTVHAPGRSYLFLRGHLVYSSLIREAKDGSWTVQIAHTTRPTPRVFGHMFFVMLGKIAAIFSIDPPIMYMASRFAAAIILFWCTYWFIKIILPKTLHALAILFVLAIEPGPMLSALTWNPQNWKAAIFSYYPQVVSFRHFGLPHHTIGEAIGLLFLGMFFLAVDKPTPKRFFLLFILGLVGTTTLPPYFVILAICVFAPWTVWALFTKSLKPLIAPLSVAAITIGGVGLFMKHEFAKGYPWKDFNLDEKRWVSNYDALVSYISTLLLYIPFVGFLWMSLTKLWKSWDSATKRLVFLMSAWVILPAVLVPISAAPWFPLANFRLMDGYNYAPMGILAAIGLHTMMRVIKKQQLASFLTGFLLTGVVIASGFLSYLYTNQAFREQNDLWTNVYLADDHWKAFTFLNTVPKRSGVMVMNHFGEILPEFAPVRSYIGSTPGYVDWSERYYIASTFFSGTQTEEQAKEILEKEDISYVYFGDAEKYFNTTGTLYPTLLTPVFETPTVTIYKVNFKSPTTLPAATGATNVP
jgi:hypothetical protein